MLLRGGVVCLLVGIAGCSGGDSAQETLRGDPHTFGVLYGSRMEVVGALPLEPFVDVGLGARIVRYEGIDRTTVSEVLEMTAFEADDVAPDDCGEPITAARLDDIGGVEGNAYVELVDVGPLEVRSGETVKRLDARSFPDLLSVVAGVVYAGDDSGGLTLVADTEVTFFAPGGGDVGAIEAASTFPRVLSNLRVGGQDPTLGVASLSRGSNLEVRWDAEGSADEIRIEVSWTQPAGAVVVTCRAHDDGLFVVPADRTRQVPELGSGVDARMTVRRVRRTAVSANGLDDGELVLQQAVTLPLRVQ